MSSTAKPHIALIGMMGSGKSTVGVLLAARLQLPFCDTDALVENAAGKAVADVINSQGEAEFRRQEQAALQQALAAPRQVIATGGGIVLDEGNRAALRRGALVLYLQADAGLLLERVQGVLSARPLLGQEADASERIGQLLAQRRALYEETAHHIVPQRDEPAVKIAERIVTIVDV